MDPITAFATAQAAVAGIQKAIKLGKDINTDHDENAVKDDVYMIESYIVS